MYYILTKQERSPRAVREESVETKSSKKYVVKIYCKIQSVERDRKRVEN